MPKQTLEQAAEQYGRRIDAEHPSNAATDFLAGVAWQKQQGIVAFKQMREALQEYIKAVEAGEITNQFDGLKAALSAALD